MDTLKSGQPRAAAAKGAAKPEDIVKGIAEKFVEEIPEPIPLNSLGDDPNSL